MQTRNVKLCDSNEILGNFSQLSVKCLSEKKKKKKSELLDERYVARLGKTQDDVRTSERKKNNKKLINVVSTWSSATDASAYLCNKMKKKICKFVSIIRLARDSVNRDCCATRFLSHCRSN